MVVGLDHCRPRGWDARGNWAAATRSSTITGIGDKAENSANVNDKLTQALQARMTSVLNSPKLTNGMTDTEIQGLKDVQRGSPTVGQHLDAPDPRHAPQRRVRLTTQVISGWDGRLADYIELEQ
jgi:hypothetical protein